MGFHYFVAGLRVVVGLIAAALLAGCAGHHQLPVRGTGDLGVIVERAEGSLLIVESSGQTRLHRVTGLGDLSHASVVYSRDARFAYVFGRDGGLTKVDILNGAIVKRVIQGGNSIGGAISQDGRWVAVSNYQPGGVKIFSAETLEQVADLPATAFDGSTSKTVGLVDVPSHGFAVSLFEGNSIWLIDLKPAADGGVETKLTQFKDVGKQPYDALITPDGRYYLAGLFGEDGMVKLDLWYPERGVQRILPEYGQGQQRLPVYKMPHLEGWAIAGRRAFVPAVGLHQVLVVGTDDWKPVTAIPVHGQPVFVMGQPGGRYVWVSFAFPKNDHIQVIDTETFQVVRTLNPGKAVLHMEFTPKGEEVWVSIRDDDKVCIFDTQSYRLERCLPADKPSGIFFTNRAHRIGL